MKFFFNRNTLLLISTLGLMFLMGCPPGKKYECINCPPKCDHLTDDQKCNCMMPDDSKNEYIIYFVDSTYVCKIDPTGKRINNRQCVISNLIKKGHSVVQTPGRQCGCSNLVLMNGNPKLTPAENIAEAQGEVEPSGDGYAGYNFDLNLGPYGFKGGIPLVDSTSEGYIPGKNSVVVGIIDMGLEFGHTAVNRFIWQNNPTSSSNCSTYPDNLVSYNFFNNNKEDILDSTGHGTHIAGIIALEDANKSSSLLQWTPEMKERLRLMSLKITEGSTQKSDLFSAACAMRYAINHDVDILNLSWGYFASKPDSGFMSVIRDAKNAGVLIVAAAGNEGLNTDKCKHWPSGFSDMSEFSEFDNVISVAAINPDTKTLADFSNYGNSTVQVAAPGDKIQSSIPGFSLSPATGSIPVPNCAKFSGTSMATPFVTRMAAIIMANNSGIPYQEVKKLILAKSNQEIKNLTGGISKIGSHQTNTLICPPGSNP